MYVLALVHVCAWVCVRSVCVLVPAICYASCSSRAVVCGVYLSDSNAIIYDGCNAERRRRPVFFFVCVGCWWIYCSAAHAR